MNRRILRLWRHPIVLAAACIAGTVTFIPAASAASLTWSVAISPSPTGPGTYPGINPVSGVTDGMVLNQTQAPDTSASLPLTGIDALHLGQFSDINLTTIGSPNVNPTFTVTISNVNNGTGIPGTATFYGSITASGSPGSTIFTIDFSTNSNGTTPASQTMTDSSYPFTGPINDKFVYEDIGSYAFGIAQSVQINSTGKSTAFYAFVAPQTAMVPEPMPFATTGLAICGLAGLMIRRKRLAQRS